MIVLTYVCNLFDIITGHAVITSLKRFTHNRVVYDRSG